MCSSEAKQVAFDAEAFASKFGGLDEAKNNANVLFRSKCYREAVESYTRLLSEIVGTDFNPSNATEVAKTVRGNGTLDERLVDFTATLMCNSALCYFNLNQLYEASSLCNACLCVDPYNYKAAFYLVKCALVSNEYQNALKHVERCQSIVDAKKLFSNQEVPHAALVRRIRESMNSDMSKKVVLERCEDIISNIASGTDVILNLKNLHMHPKQEIIREQVIPKLVAILKEKDDYVKYADVHSGIWSSIHQFFHRVDEKVESQMLEQLQRALEDNNIDVQGYARKLISNAEKNPPIASSVQPILIQFSKVCSDIRTIPALEALTLILEKCKSDAEDHVLSSILHYFTDMKGDKPVADSKFTVALTRMLETLLSYYDLDYHSGTAEHLEGCLVVIFLRRFGNYEISEESFFSIVARLLNGYITIGDPKIEGGVFLQPTCYVALKCLYVSSRDVFKTYIIVNELMGTLLSNYMSDYHAGYDRIKLQLLQSEIVILSMDFMECRQLLLDTPVKDVSIIDYLRSDVGFIKYLQGIREKESEVKEYCKSGTFHFQKYGGSTSSDALYEYKILALSKFMVHSTPVMNQILECFDLFTIVPNALVIAIMKGQQTDILIDAMSYITLHQQAKTPEMLMCMYVQMRWMEHCFDCKQKTMYMACHSIVNMFRSRDDRYGFNKHIAGNPMWDDSQLEAMREAYEKLPEASKPAQNGEFTEGDVSVADIMRGYVVMMNNDVPRCLVSIAKMIMKECQMLEKRGDKVKEEMQLKAYKLVMETLHYLMLQSINRPVMQSAGVLRMLIDAANSKVYKGTNQCRYLSQSIAHMCISSDPRVLSYRDALDSTGPLVKLLDDANELFQYEAALGLTNLLTIDDDVRTRVWSINGWNALGNLLYSDNEQLKAACLEGWCNLAAGEDVVHGYFYKKLAQQMESVENPAEVITLNIHDITILLMFAGNITELRSVKASTGTLALLVRDLRIAKYLPFFSKIKNLFKTVDEVDDADVLYRILTAMSCIMQGRVEKISPANVVHVKSIKEQIKQCTMRNITKFRNPAILNLAKEIMEYTTS